MRITLPECLPPLRMLLVLDNLTGHRTPAFVLWLFAHGVMPLYTPLGGSWLNLPKGHPQNRSNASSSGERWMGIIRRRRRRSSAGWRRQRRDGTGRRRRLSGVASAKCGASGRGNDATQSEDQQRIPNCRSTGSVQHEDMAISNTSDPLGQFEVWNASVIAQLSLSQPLPPSPDIQASSNHLALKNQAVWVSAVSAASRRLISSGRLYAWMETRTKV